MKRPLLFLLFVLLAFPAWGQVPGPPGLVVGNGTTTGTVIQGGTATDCLTVGTGNKLTQTTGCGGSGVVSSFSAGSTGFSPSSATTGAVTLAGTLIAANGGTGFASYAVGDLLYAATTTTLAKLADVATTNVLLSGGVGVAPAWGKVDVSAAVTGVLLGANGGTGVANTSKTITLGGNLTTSGAFASTFTMTNTTAVTFPTSGTLAAVGGNLGVFSGTSLALGGATIGSDALGVTGTSTFSGLLAIAGGNAMRFNSFLWVVPLATGQMQLLNGGANAGGVINVATDAIFKLFARDGTTPAGLQTGAVTLSSGTALQLGNAYVNTLSVGTGYVLVTDSTGTVYEIPAKAH